MPSQFDAGFELSAAPMIDSHFGVAATLTRGGLTTASSFTATFEQRQYELDDAGGVNTSITGRAWNVKRSDYKTTGSALTPMPGDVLNVEGEQWQVQPMGLARSNEKRPCYELLAGDLRWLVHTKRVS